MNKCVFHALAASLIFLGSTVAQADGWSNVRRALENPSGELSKSLKKLSPRGLKAVREISMCSADPKRWLVVMVDVPAKDVAATAAFLYVAYTHNIQGGIAVEEAVNELFKATRTDECTIIATPLYAGTLIVPKKWTGKYRPAVVVTEVGAIKLFDGVIGGGPAMIDLVDGQIRREFKVDPSTSVGKFTVTGDPRKRAMAGVWIPDDYAGKKVTVQVSLKVIKGNAFVVLDHFYDKDNAWVRQSQTLTPGFSGTIALESYTLPEGTWAKREHGKAWDASVMATGGSEVEIYSITVRTE